MTVPDRAARGPVPVIWGDVPPRNKNFTGREAILEQLKRRSSSRITSVLQEDPLPQALQGLGGVGKTAVAIEYANRYRADYDIVWWIPAEQLPLVRASLAALAGRLGLEAAIVTGIEGAAAAALDALRRGEPYSRWLLIFDNADQPEDLREYIPRGPGDVLVTSRNPTWQATVDMVRADVFSRTESRDFLIKRVPVKARDPAIDLLADKLGDLPLALDQAGAVLSETGMPVDEYIELLDARFSRIMSEGRSQDYPMSVTAAWAISVDKARQQMPQAQELLRCCAFFGPNQIPRDIFRHQTQVTGTQLDDLMKDPILLARAIRELSRSGLVSIGDRGITVHRLIQALIRDELDEPEQARYRREVHSILAAAAPPDPADDRQWPWYGDLLPHVMSEATDMVRSHDPSVRSFALKMMRYLYLSGDLAGCQELTHRFVEQWTADSGPDDPSVIAAQCQYGEALRELGRYSEAHSVNEDAMRHARDVLSPDDPVTLAVQSSLAADQRAQGKFQAAWELDSKTLELSEATSGENAVQSLRGIANLGLDYGLNASYGKATELLKRAYMLMSGATAGTGATEILITWYNLAWSLRLEGRYSEARDVSEEAWDYGKERLGPDHFATLRAANGLSIALRRIAPRHEEAMEIAHQVYDNSRKRFGDSHPDTMAAAINVTNTQRANGLIMEALALAEKTVARYPDIYGPDHPFTYGCTGNLALLRRITGDPAEARRLNEFVLAGLDATLTRDHDYSLAVAVNLASDLAMLGETVAARSLGEDTLKRFINLLGNDHPLTLGCAANLVLDLRAVSAKAEAEALFTHTMSRYEATCGLGHPDAVSAAEGRRLDFDFDPPPI